MGSASSSIRASNANASSAINARARREIFPVYPIDEKFMHALEKGIPPSAGNALGVDRLVALACTIPNAEIDIARVMAFFGGRGVSWQPIGLT